MESELLTKDKECEIKSIKDKAVKEREFFEQKVKDLEEKVSWFRENQQLLAEQSTSLKKYQTTIRDL